MCTLEKRANVYILTLTGTDDHRLNPNLIDSISAALRRICSEITTSSIPAALITTAEGNYFCNGGDLAWVQSNKTRLLLMLRKMRALFTELMTLPMPTIAAVNGHVGGGGYFLALSHDYILMRKDRGYLYMSELDNGVVLAAPYMSAMVRAKISNPVVWRDVVLKAERMTADTAVKKGIIDEVCGNVEETVTKAVAIGEELVKRKWKGEVYAENRHILFGEVLVALKIDDTEKDLARTGLLPVSNGRGESRL